MAKRKKKKKRKSSKSFTGNFGSKVTRNAQQQRQSRSNYGYLKMPKGMPIFSPEPKSKIRLDIMPYEVTDPQHPDRFDDENIAVPGSLWYRRPFSIHRNIGVSNDTVVCPASTGDSKCPICEYRQKRLREGVDYQDDSIQSIRPSDRNLYVVVPVKSREYDEVLHIWDMSQYLFQELLNEELEEFPEMGVFPDLEDGKTLRIRWDEGRIGENTFPEASRIDFVDRDKPYDEDILDDIPDLDEVLQVMSYKELEAKFFEIEDEDYAEEGIEEEETERRSRSEIREEAEEDEEFEDDWEDDEEFEDDFEDDFEEDDWDDFEDDFEDEEFEDDFEDEEWEDDFEDDFEDEEEFEEEPEPEPKKKKKSRKKKKKTAKRKKKPKRKKKVKRKKKKKRKRKSE